MIHSSRCLSVSSPPSQASLFHISALLMAPNFQYSLYCCIFFVVIVFSHAVLLSEGRHLMGKKQNMMCKKCMAQGETRVEESREGVVISKPKGMHSHTTNTSTSSKATDVNAIRPTTPGHSPSIGHSLLN